LVVLGAVLLKLFLVIEDLCDCRVVVLEVTRWFTVVKVYQHVCEIAAKFVLCLGKLLRRLVLGLLLWLSLLLLIDGRIAGRLGVRRCCLSTVLPSRIVRFFPLFNTERTLFGKLIFIFLIIFFRLFLPVLIVFFFSVDFLLFLTLLRIFRVDLLQNLRI